MNNLKIHHIGYLVKKINAAVKNFEYLGFTMVQDIIYDDYRKINICFLEKDGYTIELVSPTDNSSVVAGLLKKCKNSPYHICYESEHFEEDFARLQEKGYVAIDAPTPAPAIDSRLVVFLINASLGMIELLKKNLHNHLRNLA